MTSLSHLRLLASIFNPSSGPYMVTTKHGNQTILGRVWASSLEEATVRGSIAGEVIGVQKMEVA